MKRVFGKLKLTTMALATAALVSVVPVQSASADMLGGLIGATAGGFLGSTVGKGSGKLVATAAGAVIGYGVGDHVTGQNDRYESGRDYRDYDYYEPRRTVVRPIVIERPVVTREIVRTRVIERPTKVVVIKEKYHHKPYRPRYERPYKTVVVKKTKVIRRY